MGSDSEKVIEFVGSRDWIAGVCTTLTKARWVRGRSWRLFVYVEDGGTARAHVAHPRRPRTPKLSLKSPSENVANSPPGFCLSVSRSRPVKADSRVHGREHLCYKQKQNQKKL